MSQREVVFVDGVRTAFGTLGRTLRYLTMEELAGLALKGWQKRPRLQKRHTWILFFADLPLAVRPP
jgi:hypothetical protein